MMGSHRLIAKSVMFEEAVRVPMCLRLPGQSSSRRITGPVSQIDVIPTLLDLMGAHLPDHLQGRSQLPLMEGNARAARDDVFAEWNPSAGERTKADEAGDEPSELVKGATKKELAKSAADPVRAVITTDLWKFNCSPTCGEHELYDLNSDPGETTNLAGRKEHRARMGQMLSRIRDWQKRTGDTVELPEV